MKKPNKLAESIIYDLVIHLRSLFLLVLSHNNIVMAMAKGHVMRRILGFMWLLSWDFCSGMDSYTVRFVRV
jgi:hypothetical protein